MLFIGCLSNQVVKRSYMLLFCFVRCCSKECQTVSSQHPMQIEVSDPPETHPPQQGQFLNIKESLAASHCAQRRGRGISQHFAEARVG